MVIGVGGVLKAPVASAAVYHQVMILLLFAVFNDDLHCDSDLKKYIK